MTNKVLNNIAKKSGKAPESLKQAIKNMIDEVYSTPDFDSYDIIPHKDKKPNTDEFIDFWGKFFSELIKSKKLYK